MNPFLTGLLFLLGGGSVLAIVIFTVLWIRNPETAFRVLAAFCRVLHLPGPKHKFRFGVFPSSADDAPSYSFYTLDGAVQYRALLIGTGRYADVSAIARI